MPGKLDEISRVIGSLEASVKLLSQLFDQHCQDDDRRHKENQDVAKATIEEIAALREALQPLAASVAVMRPIVDSLQFSRMKLAAWASVGIFILGVVGWIVEALVKFAVNWTLSHFQ